MGLHVVGFSEEKAIASGVASLFSTSNTMINIEDNCNSNAKEKLTMDLSGNSKKEIAIFVPQESSNLVKAKSAIDADGFQIDAVIVNTDSINENPKEDRVSSTGSLPIMEWNVANFKSCNLAKTIIAEKPLPSLVDLNNANFTTAVPVIQNFGDVVEVISIVANESEPQHQELQPEVPDADHSNDTDLPTQNDKVIVEGDIASIQAIEDRAHMNEFGKIEADTTVKQEATTMSIEGNNNMVGADIESFFSGK